MLRCVTPVCMAVNDIFTSDEWEVDVDITLSSPLRIRAHCTRQGIPMTKRMTLLCNQMVTLKSYCINLVEPL